MLIKTIDTTTNDNQQYNIDSDDDILGTLEPVDEETCEEFDTNGLGSYHDVMYENDIEKVMTY